MPLPEGYRPKEGDELLIRVKTRFDVDPLDTDVHVITHDYQKFTIDLAKVEALYCRAWKPKDRVVICDGSGSHGVVIATYDRQVWIRLDQTPGKLDELQTYYANNLAPETPPEESES